MNLMKLKFIFILALLLVIAVNLSESFVDILNVYSQRRNNPFFFSGYRFTGLEKTFKNIKYAGYYTDKNLDESSIAANFAQAQYILAPTILDLNAANHELILFDCSSQEIARQKIEEIKAIPLKRNKFGVILARKNVPKDSAP